MGILVMGMASIWTLLLISEVMWHSLMCTHSTIPYNELEKYTLKITATCPWGQWVNTLSGLINGNRYTASTTQVSMVVPGNQVPSHEAGTPYECRKLENTKIYDDKVQNKCYVIINHSLLGELLMIKPTFAYINRLMQRTGVTSFLH